MGAVRLYGRVNMQSWSELRLSFEQSFGVLDLDTDTEIKSDYRMYM